jgi:GNAT superfamily N-acetyltransferase
VFAKTGPVAGSFAQVVIGIADVGDAGVVAGLRSQWSAGVDADAVFEQRMSDWLASERERRTTWLARVDGVPVGMASMLEYRRMPRPGRPDSRWGYIGNMFVLRDRRGRGIGSAVLGELISVAQARGYTRLVLSPSERSIDFYRRAGFVWPDQSAGGDRLLVRPCEPMDTP